MKKTEVLLAEMKEKKSKHGNSYFEGKYEGKGRIIIRKVTVAHGKKTWKLFVVQ